MKPEKTFRAGSISVNIWKNENTKNDEKVEYKTISIQRGYKDKDDKWQNTNSLRIGDIPKVRMLLNKAYEYLTLSEDKNEEG